MSGPPPKIKTELTRRLKEALTGSSTFVNLDLPELTSASQEKFDKLMKSVAENISEGVIENAEEMLKGFGPAQTPPPPPPPDATPPQGQDGFTEDMKNGIMPDKNEEATPAPQKEIPKEQGNSAPQKTPPSENPPEKENKTGNPEEKEEEQPEPEPKQENEPEENKEEEQDANLPSQKGIVTHIVNAIRNRGKIKELSKELKKLQKQIKGIQRAIRLKNVALKALQIQKLPLVSAKIVTDVARKTLGIFNCCGGCCLLAFIVPATIIIKKMLDGFSFFLGNAIKKIDGQIQSLKQIILQLQAQMKLLQKEYTQKERELYALLNQNLLGERMATIQRTKSKK